LWSKLYFFTNFCCIRIEVFQNCHCITRQRNSYGSFRGIWLVSLMPQYTLLILKELSVVLVRICHSVNCRVWVEYRDTNFVFLYKIKQNGKGHPKTGHEGSEREYRYTSTLLLKSALDGGGQRHTSAVLPRGKTPRTHCTES
jgi:hypothetical protein